MYSAIVALLLIFTNPLYATQTKQSSAEDYFSESGGIAKWIQCQDDFLKIWTKSAIEESKEKINEIQKMMPGTNPAEMIQFGPWLTKNANQTESGALLNTDTLQAITPSMDLESTEALKRYANAVIELQVKGSAPLEENLARIIKQGKEAVFERLRLATSNPKFDFNPTKDALSMIMFTMHRVSCFRAICNINDYVFSKDQGFFWRSLNPALDEYIEKSKQVMTMMRTFLAFDKQYVSHAVSAGNTSGEYQAWLEARPSFFKRVNEILGLQFNTFLLTLFHAGWRPEDIKRVLVQRGIMKLTPEDRLPARWDNILSLKSTFTNGYKKYGLSLGLGHVEEKRRADMWGRAKDFISQLMATIGKDYTKVDKEYFQKPKYKALGPKSTNIVKMLPASLKAPEDWKQNMNALMAMNAVRMAVKDYVLNRQEASNDPTLFKSLYSKTEDIFKVPMESITYSMRRQIQLFNAVRFLRDTANQAGLTFPITEAESFEPAHAQKLLDTLLSTEEKYYHKAIQTTAAHIYYAKALMLTEIKSIMDKGGEKTPYELWNTAMQQLNWPINYKLKKELLLTGKLSIETWSKEDFLTYYALLDDVLMIPNGKEMLKAIQMLTTRFGKEGNTAKMILELIEKTLESERYDLIPTFFQRKDLTAVQCLKILEQQESSN